MEEESPEVKLLKLMTSAYSSIIVIEELGAELDKNSEITIQKFFSKVVGTHLHENNWDPFNPGVILMSSYLSLILGKEKWYPLLPNGNARSSPEEWVICNCTFNDSCNRNPTLKHVIKRMRNGFSHGNIECDIPQKIKSMSRHEALKQTIFTIKDKSPESSFLIKISAHDLWNLNCKIFDEINNDELRKLK